MFKLLDADGDTVRFPHAKLLQVSRMTRLVAIDRMNAAGSPSGIENSSDWVNCVVRGTRDKTSPGEHRQFSYVPLPSIGPEHADAMIRNVMIVAPLGMERELEYLTERMKGEFLNPKQYAHQYPDDPKPPSPEHIELEPFKPLPGRFIESCYLAKADTWQTVTPIILPGYGGHKAKRAEELINLALPQSGIETPGEYVWQALPFFKNTLSAHKPDAQGRHAVYFRPPYLAENTAVHLRIRFGRRQIAGDTASAWIPASVTGPVVIGAGRHCGFGLLAATTT